MRFKSKAENLTQLEKNVTLFRIPKLVTIRVSDYVDHKSLWVAAIAEQFDGTKVAVRSSAADEDLPTASAAGRYTSVLDIDPNSTEELMNAIQQVIDSFEVNRKSQVGDSILVQKMVSASSLSGVVFTHELNTGAPYYVINYDDCSGATNTVTSGEGEYSNRTLYVHRGSIKAVRSKRFQLLLKAIIELEEIAGSQCLDIEFAMTEDLTPYLFQVRAITTTDNWSKGIASSVDAHLGGINRFLSGRFCRMKNVFGETTVFSQMSDWNPAEIIGRAPRALSFSIYEELVTNSVWAEAREQMGYQVPTGTPLMVSLGGQPFIDTRLSFHSFLPSELPAGISEKLVNIWVARLRECPELHDKVEFEVATTAYTFDLTERLLGQNVNELSEEEIRVFVKAVRKQTLGLLRIDNGSSIKGALNSIGILASSTSGHTSKKKPGWHFLSEKITACKSLGTTPFAILARHAFIAKALLDSLVRLRMMTVAEVENFYGSLETVASQLVVDMRLYQKKQISEEEMASKYGHLRPGTYDITSMRYDQMLHTASRQNVSEKNKGVEPFQLNPQLEQKVNNLLKQHEMEGLSAADLFAYCKMAIAGREYSKFIFTKTLSDIIETLAELGQEHDLSREEMSHVPLGSILETLSQSSTRKIEEQWREISRQNCSRHAESVAIRLPQVLFDLEGIYVVPFQISHPNFITRVKVTGEKTCIAANDPISELDKRIVMIENADPGFDWIFSYDIIGLITKYGGANSHMAIRCAEFGIPAAIGCGEQRYDSLLKSSHILLDAASGLVTPFQGS